MAVTSMRNSSIKKFEKRNTMRPVQTAAVVSATTGSPTITSIVVDGDDYDVYKFTGSGTITFSQGGLIDAFVIGGGGGGAQISNRRAGGGAGGCRFGTFQIGSGTKTITIGGGGNSLSALANTDQVRAGGDGSNSSIEDLLTCGGGQGALAGRDINKTASGNGSGGAKNANQNAQFDGGGAGTGVNGISTSIDGTATTYGIGGGGAGTGNQPANTGNGGQTADSNGGSGIVIVRVKV